MNGHCALEYLCMPPSPNPFTSLPSLLRDLTCRQHDGDI